MAARWWTQQHHHFEDPRPLPQHGCCPEPHADTCPEPGGSWLEHCNNANPTPTPKVTYPPTYSNLSESEGRVLGQGASAMATNCLAVCPLLARPRTQKEISQSPPGFVQGGRGLQAPNPVNKGASSPVPPPSLGLSNFLCKLFWDGEGVVMGAVPPPAQ